MRLHLLCSLAGAASALTVAPVVPQRCSAGSIAPPAIPEGRMLGLFATPVQWNFNGSTLAAASTLRFCNVTVTYTHPGKNDEVHTTVFLPFEHWNGRLQGSGGGGYAMRHEDQTLVDAVALNYSVVATDGGHAVVTGTSTSWSLDANNNVNMALLENFAYRALHDAAVIGKQVTHSFYGRPAHHAYWNGCSTGGRQGYMLAQRYPRDYDGIMAAAPAINWPTFLVAEYWPQFIMNELKTYPATCVTDFITAAAVKACDANDGVVDGVITNPNNCTFDPRTLIGTTIPKCNGTAVQVTSQDVAVVRLTWDGLRAANGSSLWYGLEKGAPLSQGDSSLGQTSYPSSGSKNYTGIPFSISADWISRFVLQDPSVNLTRLQHADLDRILADSRTRYNPVIGTDDPNLDAFKRSGGKLLTWHGLADQLIFPKGTQHYYRAVEQRDPALRDFYRFFEAPGVEHCRGGAGGVPVDPLAAVVNWVEQGVAPASLDAVTSDGAQRVLCPWPLVAVYKGGDTRLKASYECRQK